MAPGFVFVSLIDYGKIYSAHEYALQKLSMYSFRSFRHHCPHGHMWLILLVILFDI